MPTNRRDVLKGSVAVAVRSVLYGSGAGVAAALSSCGGGGGGGAAAAPAPSSLSYSTPAKTTVGLAAGSIVPTVTGSVTSYSVSPALPAGLSLNTSTGVISGTPSAVAPQATYTITATNGSGSTTFALALIVNPALALNSLSNAAPVAFTPVLLTTVGLDVTQPFTVNLTIGMAAATGLTPYRTDSDGTIHVAMPVNVDATGATAGYAATLSLVQGPQTTAPVALSVQDIPPLSTYGTNLGAISHAFYNYLALTQSRVVNELQAIGVSYPAVDTRASQSTLTTLALNSLHARNDIDRITNDQTLQIPAGVDSTGVTYYFTSASVEIQDRIFGFYLTQMQGPVSAAPAAVRTIARRQRRASKGIQAHVKAGASQLNILTTILGGAIGSTLSIAGGMKNAVDPASNTNGITAALDTASACLFGATKVLAIAGFGTGGATDVAALVTGAAGGVCALASDLIKYSNSQDQIIALQANGGSQAALDSAIQARGAAGVSAITDVVGGALSVLPGISAFKALQEGSTALNVAYQGASLVTGIAALSADAIAKEITTANSAGDQLATVAASPAQGFADLTGFTIISNVYAGTDLQTLYQADLTIPGTGASALLNSMTDVSGAYDVLVPLAAPTFNYSLAGLQISDPTTGLILGSEPLDLSALTATGTTAPLISGTCTDDDASAPDGEDPDCD